MVASRPRASCLHIYLVNWNTCVRICLRAPAYPRELNYFITTLCTCVQTTQTTFLLPAVNATSCFITDLYSQTNYNYVAHLFRHIILFTPMKYACVRWCLKIRHFCRIMPHLIVYLLSITTYSKYQQYVLRKLLRAYVT